MTKTQAEIEDKFWTSLKSDMTIMLGIDGVENEHSQPMTALLDGEARRGPLWIFTSKDTEFAKQLGDRHNGVAHYVSKGHDVFATLSGVLTRDNDPAVIDRLWSPFIAAWFKDGQTDPKLLLLRFDPDEAQIWLNEHSLIASMKLLLGKDPKKDDQGKTADIDMR